MLVTCICSYDYQVQPDAGWVLMTILFVMYLRDYCTDVFIFLYVHMFYMYAGHRPTTYNIPSGAHYVFIRVCMVCGSLRNSLSFVLIVYFYGFRYFRFQKEGIVLIALYPMEFYSTVSVYKLL